MWYTIYSGPVLVNLSEALKRRLMEGDAPLALTYDEAKSTIQLAFDDEGFRLEDFQEFFACAKQRGSFQVYFEDHKGDSTYDVLYGPGYCEEDSSPAR